MGMDFRLRADLVNLLDIIEDERKECEEYSRLPLTYDDQAETDIKIYRAKAEVYEEIYNKLNEILDKNLHGYPL